MAVEWPGNREMRMAARYIERHAKRKDVNHTLARLTRWDLGPFRLLVRWDPEVDDPYEHQLQPEDYSRLASVTLVVGRRRRFMFEWRANR